MLDGNSGADGLGQRVGVCLGLENCPFSKVLLPITALKASCEGSGLSKSENRKKGQRG